MDKLKLLSFLFLISSIFADKGKEVWVALLGQICHPSHRTRISFELFSAAIISPSTTDQYERNLIRFLKRIYLSPDPRVQFANHNPSTA
jgi:hypothetical protein